MLTQTSELALRALIQLALIHPGRSVPPRILAERLDASPTYLAKVMRQLVRADILKSFRGAKGGVALAWPPEEISLLRIVEACQGVFIGNYCKTLAEHPQPHCSFHQAMLEWHEATTSVLSRWTLADLMQSPRKDSPCTMHSIGPPTGD